MQHGGPKRAAFFEQKQRGIQVDKKIFRRAVRDTVPVMTGYLVLGAGFGLLMRANGFGAGWAAAMSLFIYAGSMQYAGVELLASGAGLVSVALTTLMVNARHLFYGISMIGRYKHAGAAKPYLIFSLTDETYSILCSAPKDRRYDLWVSVLDQAYWVFGTVAGSLLGSALPFDTTGVDFALTALFITIFVQQWQSTRQHFPALCGVGVSAVCLWLFGPDNFLVPAMLAIAAVLLFAGERKEGGEKDA